MFSALLVTVLLCSFGVNALAQDNRGFYVGTSIDVDVDVNEETLHSSDSFTSIKSPTVISSSFGADILFGYCFQSNVFVQLGLGFGHSGDKEDRKNRSSNNIVGVDPAIGYRFRLANGLYYIPSLTFIIGYNTVKTPINDNTYQSVGLWTYGVGLSLFSLELSLPKKFALDLSIFDYSFFWTGIERTDHDVRYNLNTFAHSFSLNNSVNVTLKRYF